VTSKDQVSVRPLYRLDDFCAEFGLPRSIAYSEMRAGNLLTFKIGGRRMVRGEDALAWRDRHFTEAHAAQPAS